MPDAQIKVYNLKPGVNRELTRYAGEGGWYDCDKVRFRMSKPEKIGGWVDLNGTGSGLSFVGTPRSMHSWNLLTSEKMIAVGTDKKLTIWTGGTYYDVTPLVTTISVSNAINTTANSLLVTVSIPSHSMSPGDFVIFTATSVTVGGNILLNSAVSGDTTGSYQAIDPIPGSNSIQISATTSAAATSAGAGGDFLAKILLPIGQGSAAAGFGWGVGTWGSDTWGTGRSTALLIGLRQWTLGNFGEDLIACPKGGRIYRWDASNGTATRAVLVTASPSVVDSIIVSQEKRFVFALGCTGSDTIYDPLNIRWCSQENIDDWVVSATNTAGEQRLSGSNRIVGGTETGGDILVWTDDSLYAITYNGTKFVFSINHVGQNCGLIGTHAAQFFNGRTYWMSNGNFFYYDGNVNVLPCDVFHFVFDNLNKNQGEKVYCGTNTTFNEIIWLYQSINSTGDIDRYVIYNSVEHHWTIGTIDRSVWEDVRVISNPIAAGSEGIIYEHELGVNADGSVLPSYLESSDFDLDEGDQLIFADKIIPDFDMSGEISLRIKTKKYPGDSYTTKGPFIVSAATPKISMRARGRQAVIRFDTSTLDDDWRLGLLRFQIKPDGRQ